MTPLPPIHGLARSGAELTLEFELLADLPVFDGHFPETPILPAIAQIDWAVRLSRAHFSLPRHFRGLRSLKFLRVVQPPGRLALKLVQEGARVAFAYTQAGTACSMGRIEFADDAAGPDRSFL